MTEAREDGMTIRALSVLEWVRERYENTIRIAAKKTGADRDGWLEDAAYWHAVIELVAAATPRCDGNHGGARCADPECWNQ